MRWIVKTDQLEIKKDDISDVTVLDLRQRNLQKKMYVDRLSSFGQSWLRNHLKEAVLGQKSYCTAIS